MSKNSYPSQSDYRKKFLRANKKNLIALAICFVALVILFAIIIISAATDSDNYLTYENYEKIEMGMNYDQVVVLFNNHVGKSNRPSGNGACTYTWTDDSGTRTIIIAFDAKGRVYNKSQYGLD